MGTHLVGSFEPWEPFESSFRFETAHFYFPTLVRAGFLVLALFARVYTTVRVTSKNHIVIEITDCEF